MKKEAIKFFGTAKILDKDNKVIGKKPSPKVEVEFELPENLQECLLVPSVKDEKMAVSRFNSSLIIGIQNAGRVAMCNAIKEGNEDVPSLSQIGKDAAVEYYNTAKTPSVKGAKYSAKEAQEAAVWALSDEAKALESYKEFKVAFRAANDAMDVEAAKRILCDFAKANGLFAEETEEAVA